MPDLSFEAVAAGPLAYAMSPHVAFTLRIANRSGEPIHSLLLRCQVQLEVARRAYSATERERLRELFGTTDQWSRSLQTMLWSQTSLIVQSFVDETTVELAVPCSFDFNVAATKYFDGLEAGEVPVCLLFSGTVFYADDDGALRVEQVPWDREANYRLRLDVWRRMMDAYYPNSTWLRLGRDAFEAFYQYKRERAIPTWDAAIERAVGDAAKGGGR